MPESCFHESLKKIMQIIESLSPEKRIIATKWLEGVIIVQALTAEERENMVSAINEYLCSLDENEYKDGVNALLEYLRKA